MAILQCAAGPSPEGRGKAPRAGKLSPVLHELATTSDRTGFAASRGIALAEGRVRVYVFLAASATDRDRARLAATHGVTVEKAANGLMRARVPVDSLIDLSRDPAVSFVDIPDRPQI